MVKNDREYKAEVKRWAKDVIASIEADADDDLVCEDCEESGPDVEMRTAPSIGWMTEPPDTAVLCDGCEDQRLNPQDYAPGPDRHNEDGCDDD